ncbi:MAG TPA: YicC/YloC family endoribonuclease [Blastocatellia bacterium]
MTGFGQGSTQTDELSVRIDIRTVNNRFLDIHLKLPQELGSLEIALKKQVQASLKRGRVDILVVFDQVRQATFEVNRPLLAGYLEALRSIREEFGLAGEPSIDLLAKLPGALQVSQQSASPDEALAAAVSSAMAQALTSLTRMRITEGAELVTDLGARLDAIEGALPTIQAEASRLPAVYREKLAKRLQEINAGAVVDESRLAQEAVMLADRSDISEEIARLKSHISQMRELLTKTDDEAGKRLDFILQEMNREANTILSKSGDIAVSDAAIVIKTEVEKLREQAQNVE